MGLTKNPAAVALGSLGGQARSKRKVAAARANLRKANAARKNGQKGGWPKGKRRKEQIGREELKLLVRALEDVNLGRVKSFDQVRLDMGTPRKGKGKR